MAETIEKLSFREEIPEVEDYWMLFATTGWNREYQFSKEELDEALANSWYAVSVYDSEKLVGFGRVIADGIHHALIADLIVEPGYQDKGIGRRILERLVKRCMEARIRDIQLFATNGKGPFYRKCGFIYREPDAPGMEYNIEAAGLEDSPQE